MNQLSMLKRYIKVNNVNCEIISETNDYFKIIYYGRSEIIAKQSVTKIDSHIEKLIKKAIDRLKTFEPDEGYYLAFSGGKDSCVIYKLAEMAGVKFEAHYNLTTVDMPELVWFIKDFYPNVKINFPKLSMWKLIEKKLMPPSRKVRYCCSELKEHGGDGRFVITGVRWAESSKRKNKRAGIELNAMRKYINKVNDNDEGRKLVESCAMRSKHIINPIIDWTDGDIWSFLKGLHVPFQDDLYEKYDRLGCIGCPLTSAEKRKAELENYPKFREAYIRAFERMIAERKRKNKNCEWRSGEEVMQWWLTEPDKKTKTKVIDNQIGVI